MESLLPEGLTTRTFCEIIEEDKPIKITKIVSCAGSRIGDNNLSDVSRLEVSYERGSEESSRTFILKDTKNEVLPFVKIIRGAEKELSWYEEILPEAEKLGISISPKCYKKHKNWLLFEDLASSGYKVQDRRTMLDLKHSISAVQTLAKFHAVTHRLHELNKLPEVSMVNAQFVPSTKESTYNVRIELLPVIAKNLTEFGVNKYNDFIEYYGFFAWDRMIESIEEHQFPCLVHGDYWTTNMLFKYDDNGEILRTMMIDFQMMRLSTPAYDLHLFIISSVQPETRDEHLEAILSSYLMTLNETLESIQSKSFLTREGLNSMMESTSPAGLFLTFFFLPVVLCETRVEFSPPEHLSDEEKRSYHPFKRIFQETTYRRQLVSVLDFYKKKTNTILYKLKTV